MYKLLYDKMARDEKADVAGLCKVHVSGTISEVNGKHFSVWYHELHIKTSAAAVVHCSLSYVFFIHSNVIFLFSIQLFSSDQFTTLCDRSHITVHTIRTSSQRSSKNPTNNCRLMSRTTTFPKTVRCVKSAFHLTLIRSLPCFLVSYC